MSNGAVHSPLPILSTTSVPSLSLPLHPLPSFPPPHIRKPHRIRCNPRPSLPLRLPPPVNRPHPRHTRNTHQSRANHHKTPLETQQRNMQGAMPWDPTPRLLRLDTNSTVGSSVSVQTSHIDDCATHPANRSRDVTRVKDTESSENMEWTREARGWMRARRGRVRE